MEKNDLKTLKDIYDTSKQTYISDEAEETVKEIKKSAKEWIKRFKNNTLPHPAVIDGICPLKSEIEEIIKWIKYFFNLED